MYFCITTKWKLMQKIRHYSHCEIIHFGGGKKENSSGHFLRYQVSLWLCSDWLKRITLVHNSWLFPANKWELPHLDLCGVTPSSGVNCQVPQRACKDHGAWVSDPVSHLFQSPTLGAPGFSLYFEHTVFVSFSGPLCLPWACLNLPFLQALIMDSLPSLCKGS